MEKPDLSPKARVTYGDKYGYAMQIETQEEADAYFDECVRHQMSFGETTDRAKAEEIERSNIGYWAGYGYDREKVERLFRCKHPVFGSVAENGHPTAKEAFELGRTVGESMRKEPS